MNVVAVTHECTRSTAAALVGTSICGHIGGQQNGTLWRLRRCGWCVAGCGDAVGPLQGVAAHVAGAALTIRANGLRGHDKCVVVLNGSG